MGINFSKFTEQVQDLIKNALSDNKIDAAEIRAMNLEKNVANELMKQLAGNSMYLGDGFYRANGEKSTLILLDKPTNNMFVELTDDSLSRYRQDYKNAEKGLYRDGKIYLIDKNGKPIKDASGNYVCEDISFEETKKNLPNFFKQDGSFDTKKIQEYLNTLPETDQDYQTLMNDIEEASKEGSYWSIKNFAGTQKERFLKIYQAIENHDLEQAVELMYAFFQEECQGFDEEILLKIRSGLERLTGAKWAGPALYNALSWMAENVDNLIGRDENGIGYAQRFVVGLANVDKGLGDYIFSTEGLITMGTIVTGEALIYKTSSMLAPYIGGAIHSTFAALGFEMIYDGSKEVLTGENLDEVAKGGQKIGHGLPLAISPVAKLVKNTEVLGKNISKIKEAKSLKELDNILNDILANPMTVEERLNYCFEAYYKRAEFKEQEIIKSREGNNIQPEEYHNNINKVREHITKPEISTKEGIAGGHTIEIFDELKNIIDGNLDFSLPINEQFQVTKLQNAVTKMLNNAELNFTYENIKLTSYKKNGDKISINIDFYDKDNNKIKSLECDINQFTEFDKDKLLISIPELKIQSKTDNKQLRNAFKNMQTNLDNVSNIKIQELFNNENIKVISSEKGNISIGDVQVNGIILTFEINSGDNITIHRLALVENTDLSTSNMQYYERYFINDNYEVINGNIEPKTCVRKEELHNVLKYIDKFNSIEELSQNVPESAFYEKSFFIKYKGNIYFLNTSDGQTFNTIYPVLEDFVIARNINPNDIPDLTNIIDRQ